MPDIKPRTPKVRFYWWLLYAVLCGLDFAVGWAKELVSKRIKTDGSKPKENNNEDPDESN